MSLGLRCGRLFIAQIWLLLSICIKELPCPWWCSEPRDPTSLCLSTSPCQPFLPSPFLTISKPHPYSSHMTGHIQERWLAWHAVTLLPFTHKILQAHSEFPFMELLCWYQFKPGGHLYNPRQADPSSAPLPGSRQCRSRTELMAGCRRGSPAEAAGAAQCSGEDRQGN